MRSLTAAFAALPAVLVVARDVGDAHVARQDPPPPPPPPPTVTTPSPSPPSSPAPSISGSSFPASGSGVTSNGTLTGPATLPTTFTFSLQSTNPTAVPLSSIVAGVSSAPTMAVSSTPAAGSTPSVVPSAPALPDISTIIVGNYPALDKTPPTDSPEVQQWFDEVMNSGIEIPDYSPTVAGGCAANPDALADDRCWWTCTGCERETDVTTCPDKMSWGLTYDDGPSFYTPNLLQFLDEHQLKSTFFVVGSRALQFPSTLQAEYAAGHQISVHTWSHTALTTLDTRGVIAELGWTKKVIRDVLGVTPNTMRPPFGDIDDRIRQISIAMGLTPVIWTRVGPNQTYDTDDFNIHSGLTNVGEVLQNWQNILGNATQRDDGFIVLEHDLFQQSVEVATGYILPDALAHDPPFKIGPVASCLNLPLSDAYIETNNNETNPPIATGGSAVTLSSGAPGSAQETGGGSGDDDGAISLGIGYGAIAFSLVACAMSLTI